MKQLHVCLYSSISWTPPPPFPFLLTREANHPPPTPSLPTPTPQVTIGPDQFSGWLSHDFYVERPSHFTQNGHLYQEVGCLDCHDAACKHCLAIEAFIDLPAIALRQQEAFMNLSGIVLQLSIYKPFLAAARYFHKTVCHCLAAVFKPCLAAARGFHEPAWHCHADVCKPYLAAAKGFHELPGIILQLSTSLALRQQKAFMNLPGTVLQPSTSLALRGSERLS
jgi:hypothetical protein